MGLEQLEQAITEGTQLQLNADTVAFNDEKLDDASALSIVIGDTSAAVAYVLSKSLPTQWTVYDDLYRAFQEQRVWPGTNVLRSNLPMHLILEVIEKLMPEIYLSFFSEDQPFLLEPRGKTTAEAARARAKVLNWALGDEFKEQMRRTMKQCLLYGYCVGKYGWITEERTVKEYSRQAGSNTPIRKETKIQINKPIFENLEIRTYMLDAKLREQDPRKGRFVVFQKMVTADDLVDLAAMDCFKNVPTKEELRFTLTAHSEATKDSMKATKNLSWRDLQAEPVNSATNGDAFVDPLSKPLEILEWWSDDRVITVLQGIIVIRNEEHEFDVKPFVGCAFIDVMGSAYGFGIAKLLAGEQLFETGVINSWVDWLALQLSPMFVTEKGVSSGTQQIKSSPGKVITDAGGLKPLMLPSITQEAMNAIEGSENRSNRRVGSNGGSDMPTQALRTAQGVNAFQQDVTSRLEYFIDIFGSLVYKPTLEAYIKMLNDKLDIDQIQQILSDVDGQEYEGDIMEVYNANTSVQVLSSTKLGAKKASAQLVPALIQLISAQPVQDSLTQQAKKADLAELVEDAMASAGMDVDEFIKDMTPDDLQRAAQMNPALQKAQGDAQKQNLDNQGKLQQIEAQGTAKAGVEVVKHILDESKAENQLPAQLQQLMGQGQTPTPQIQQTAPQPVQPMPQPHVDNTPVPSTDLHLKNPSHSDHFQGANEGSK